jgi:hypothetical protein
MSIHHRSHVTSGALSLLLAGVAIACSACGAHAESKPPQSAAAAPAGASAPRAEGSAPAASPGASAPGAGASASASGQSGAPHAAGPSGPNGANDEGDDRQEDDAELVVSRDVVALCPSLRLVRQHVADFDPDMVWLAVLESLGECMGQGGPMAMQSIGVSGDEEHRHVVREVLGSRGVAPVRVIATPVAQGAAECQGGVDCSKRVEITIAPATP